MLIDGNSLEERTLTAQDCVIGSGMGGTAIAKTLVQAGKEVLLIEAGNTSPHTEPSSVIGAEHVGRPFGIPLSRCIELGGTSNQWHGICGTLDPIDFEPRPWIKGSGWPIRRRDLDPYYSEAARLLDIRDTETTEIERLDESHRARLGDIRFEPTVLTNKVVQFRKPPRRWKDTLVEMAKAGLIRCVLNASALELLTTDGGDSIEQLVVGVGGRRISVKADVFIVCAGGLETPRLLLNSNRRHPEGIGNSNGLVGRYLLDHPVGHFCKIGFQKRTDAPFYASMANDGAAGLMTGLMLTDAVQREDQLPNHYLWIRPSVSPIRLDDDLLYVFLAVRSARDLSMRQIWAILTNRDILYRVLVHRFGLHPRYHYGDLFFMTEQLPNADSSVSLSSKRTDRHGYPVARVDWQLSPEDFQSFERYADVLLERGLRSQQYDVARRDDPAVWRDTVVSAAHHLGTARMANDPTTGVVDRDLRVFGMQNLYVCDGSVFATAGSVNPSLTITALGVRLGQHLAQRDRSVSVSTQQKTQLTLQ